MTSRTSTVLKGTPGRHPMPNATRAFVPSCGGDVPSMLPLWTYPREREEHATGTFTRPWIEGAGLDLRVGRVCRSRDRRHGTHNSRTLDRGPNRSSTDRRQWRTGSSAIGFAPHDAGRLAVLRRA